jgi:hypothetical protein
MTDSILIEADKSAWPLAPGERTWGPVKLGISLATVAAATWCYIIGEYVGYYLNFKQGFFALLAGSMIGMLIVALAAVPVSIRFGVDSIASSKPQFGSRGWMIPAALQFMSIIGWNSLLLIFFAKSTVQLLVALGWISADNPGYIVQATVLLASVLVFLFLLKGSSGVDRVSKILVAHVAVGFWMLYILLTYRWADLQTAVPAYASTDARWNYVTGIELGIVSLLSWWPYIGAMVRMAPNGRTVAAPVMLCGHSGAADFRPCRVDANHRRTNLRDHRADLCRGGEPRDLGCRRLRFVDRLAPLPDAAKPQLADAAATFDRAGCGCRRGHPRVVLREFRDVPGLYRGQLCPALWHPDCRLLCAA